MRPIILAAAAMIAATPALAQTTVYPDPGSSSDSPTSNNQVTPPAANPNVDNATVAADQARQNYYQDKLDAAKAQAKADSAMADRDAAQAQAEEDRDAANDAEEAR